MTSTLRCRVFYRNRSQIWDIAAPLTLDKNYLLEVKNGYLWVRDFMAPQGEKSKIQRFPFSTPIHTQKLEIHPKQMITVMPIHYPEMVTLESAGKVTAPSIDFHVPLSAEDITFKKGVRNVTSTAAVLSLLILLMNFMESTPETKEELIPQKYAKLILSKPKPTQNTSASGVSAKSQAQTKAIARAFQSKTIQKSIKSILSGGLSKYSVMATGRSIQSLSEKMLSQTNAAGTGLEKRNNAILGAMAGGNFQVGSDNGYGSGNGTQVKGQGTGHLEIGLNLKDATVDEGLTKEEVAKVIHSHMNEIRYCYESAILNDPSLAGKVLVDFKIGAQGSVATAQAAENTMNNVQVGGCLVGKLRNWKFPQPRGGVMVAVSYPFIFKSLTR